MYDIFFCPEYPIGDIHVSELVCREGRETWRLALAENIRENGLANPLFVLNHRDPARYAAKHLMTGTNRIWALQHLGWVTAPCVVTGSCEYPCTQIQFEEIQEYFADGEIYNGTHGPRVRDVCKPEEYTYPPVRDEVRHRMSKG